MMFIFHDEACLARRGPASTTWIMKNHNRRCLGGTLTDPMPILKPDSWLLRGGDSGFHKNRSRYKRDQVFINQQLLD